MTSGVDAEKPHAASKSAAYQSTLVTNPFWNPSWRANGDVESTTKKSKTVGRPALSVEILNVSLDGVLSVR